MRTNLHSARQGVATRPRGNGIHDRQLGVGGTLRS